MVNSAIVPSGGKVILSGREEQLKPMITLLMAIGQLIDSKDIGEIVATDLYTDVRGKVVPKIILSCFWAAQPHPPYTKVNGKRVIINCKVPFVPRSNINYDTIINAMGGMKGYLWGHWMGVAQLSESNGHLKIFGSSKSVVNDRIQAIASLSNANILSLNITEEQPAGLKIPGSYLWKEDTRIYPHYCTIINQALIQFTDKQMGVQTLDGAVARKKSKLWLYFKPTDWDATVANLFKLASYGD
jgi:hypothetical protein